MFDKVMIGIDDEQGGRDAIALARQLVSDDGTFTLAYVHGGYPILGKGSGASSPFIDAERQRAQEVLTKSANEAGIDASFASTGSSSVGRGLHELAERNGADLLVIGSTRHGLLGRVLMGDDTRAALNGGPCAVAIAPAGYADHAEPLERIGVAFDDSPESRHALGVARELGSYFGATLSACDVLVSPAYMYLGGPVPVSDFDHDKLSEQFQPGLLDGVELKATYGFASEKLGLYSESVDLLVAGSRGYGPLGRLVHGSTSAQLTRTVMCPLLVLTRSSQRAPEGEFAGTGEVAIQA